MEETYEQRWKQAQALADQYKKQLDEKNSQLQMAQDLLRAMAETTGRAAIRVEWRLTKGGEKNIFVIATSAKGMEEHLARLVGGSYAALMKASEYPIETEEG